MGGRFSALLRVSVFAGIFAVTSLLYADDPATQSQAQTQSQTGVRSTAKRLTDSAFQPGTYQTVENLVKVIGDGIDWYFDRLVVGANAVRLPEASNAFVSGIGNGIHEVGAYNATENSLNYVEDTAGKYYVRDFDQQILKGSPVKVHPYFKSAMEYYSNVFYEPEAPKTRDEVLWIQTPGVTADLFFGDKQQYHVAAAYEARITEFTKYHEHDNIGQSFGVLGDFKLTDALYTKIKEEFVDDTARAGTRSAKNVDYKENTVTPTIGYNWRDWTVEGDYWNSIRDFDSSIYRIFSYANNGFQTRVLRTVAPNFRALVDYTLSHYDYAADETRVGHYSQIRGGVTGKLSERTDFTGRIGYQNREYKQHDTEFDIPVFDVRLTHRLTSKTTLNFYTHRATEESSFTNNRAYDEKLFQASGSYLFNSRFRGRAGTSYGRRDFDNVATTGAVVSQRRDTFVTAFVGLDYIFRPWLIMNLDYKYERCNSSNSNFDYTNNLVSIGTTSPF